MMPVPDSERYMKIGEALVDRYFYYRAFRKAVDCNIHSFERAEAHGVRYEPLQKHIAELLVTKHHCYWCGRSLLLHEKTIDHVVPISRGGGHIMGNVVVSCWPCNRDKGSMSKLEFERMLEEGVCHEHDMG